MIRRTVARAFGSPGEERPSLEKAVPPGPRASRIQVMNALFNEIQETFERAAAERSGAAASSGLRVGRPHPLAEGIEFTVEVAAGTFRFLNAMDGIAWIHREADGRRIEDRLLSVLFEDGRPRLIEKPAGVPRAPFRTTSPRELVGSFLGSPAGQATARPASR
jgi:hypothetical protein